MKRKKAFFEFVKQLAIGGVIGEINGSTGSLYKSFVVKSKAIIFAAILVPCFLQFPLLAFGQERTDGVNGSRVPLKVSGECVKTEGIVAESGGAISKGGLEGVNRRAHGITSAVPNSKPLSNQQNEQRSSDTEEQHIGLREGRRHHDPAFQECPQERQVTLMFPAPITPPSKPTGPATHSPATDLIRPNPFLWADIWVEEHFGHFIWRGGCFSVVRVR